MPYQLLDFVQRADVEFESFFDPSEFEARVRLEQGHYWHLHRRAVVLDVLRAAGVGPEQALIELGCGVGTVTTHLNQNGLRVDYCDVHQQGLRLAIERAKLALDPGATPRFLRADITERLPPGNYDGMLLLDVLEHLPDDRAVVRAVHDRLCSGTNVPRARFIVFTVPAFQALWSPWDELEKHKRRYTLDGARDLAEQAGFEVERATYFFFPLFFAASAVKALRLANEQLRERERAPQFDSMVETRNHPVLNAAMLKILDLERRWLRRRDLSLGTSVLVLARPRDRHLGG